MSAPVRWVADSCPYDSPVGHVLEESRVDGSALCGAQCEDDWWSAWVFKNSETYSECLDCSQAVDAGKPVPDPDSLEVRRDR